MYHSPSQKCPFLSQGPGPFVNQAPARVCPPQNCPFTLGIPTRSNTWLDGTTKSQRPNNISIGTYRGQARISPPSKLPLAYLDPHLIHAYMHTKRDLSWFSCFYRIHPHYVHANTVHATTSLAIGCIFAVLTTHKRLTAFSRTTWVGRYQKDKPFWILLQQEMMGWQWYQLNHTQIICTSLQTDNHAST